MIRALQLLLKYLGAYLLGIAVCVLLTPADLVLAGRALWPYYPAFAVFGFFLFYSTLPPQYVFGPDLGYWLVYSIGLIAVVIGLTLPLGPLRRLRPLRPLLIGFPIGFIGTLGVFYTAAASI
mgnify:CR=1 FL=1